MDIEVEMTEEITRGVMTEETVIEIETITARNKKVVAEVEAKVTTRKRKAAEREAMIAID